MKICRTLSAVALLLTLALPALAETEFQVTDNHPSGNGPDNILPTGETITIPTLAPAEAGCPSPHLHGFAFGHDDPAPSNCGHGIGVPITHGGGGTTPAPPGDGADASGKDHIGSTFVIHEPSGQTCHLQSHTAPHQQARRSRIDLAAALSTKDLEALGEAIQDAETDVQTWSRHAKKQARDLRLHLADKAAFEEANSKVTDATERRINVRKREREKDRAVKAAQKARLRARDAIKKLTQLQKMLENTKRMGELIEDLFGIDDSSHSSTPQVQPPDERVSPDRPAADAPQAPSPTFPPADQPATKPNVLDGIREAIL